MHCGRTYSWANRLDMAFVNIVALWTVLLIVMILFLRVDRGGGLMVLYAVLVAFASYLNFVLWRLNRVYRAP